MNKKIILSLGAVALLTSSLFAYNGQGNMKDGCKGKSGYHKMMKKGSHHKKGARIGSIVMQLDLSDKQRSQIKEILQNSKKDLPNPHSAFSDSSFDKDKFIKLSNDRKNNRVEKKAETISKIYALLNESQKKDLKTMLDAKEIMKRKMIQKGDCNGKNCNGGR